MRFWMCAFAAALCLAPAAGRAELYECRGADGKTLFTSDHSQCPGAAVHEPTGHVQRTQSGGAPSAPAAPAAALRPPAHGAGDEAEAQAWRAKRKNAEAALKQTETKLDTLRGAAAWCNRGHEVWARDQDGLRHGLDCKDIDSAQATLEREHQRLEEYLDGGLEDECRRAGCLPGWIR